ncbi:MAG: hypothetical protein U0636_05055 [Phycisphaerales bacterium]
MLHQAAGALGATMQEALELLRVAPSAMDDNARQRVDQAMERLKPQVMGNLARAAGLKRPGSRCLAWPTPASTCASWEGCAAPPAWRWRMACGRRAARWLAGGAGVILAVRAAAL